MMRMLMIVCRVVFTRFQAHTWHAHVSSTYDSFQPDLQPGRAFERLTWHFTQARLTLPDELPR